MKIASLAISLFILASNKLILLMLPISIQDYSYNYYFYFIIPTILIYTCTILKKEFSVTFGVVMSLYTSLVYILEFYLLKNYYLKNHPSEFNEYKNNQKMFFKQEPFIGH